MKARCLRLALAAGCSLLMFGGTRAAGPLPSTPVWSVPFLDEPFTIDGALDDPCYRAASRLTNFVIAGDPARPPQATSAWLFWTKDRLLFAFDCDDPTLVASPPTADERDVDRQDRVELFLWSGHENTAYFCLELAPRGAVHHYAARFYRQFDDAWTPDGWQYTAKVHPRGYTVEAALSRAALEPMGVSLRAGQRWRAGLFRADFTPERPESPDWITWVDARTPRPDFHVAPAFGTLVLESPRPPPED